MSKNCFAVSRPTSVNPRVEGSAAGGKSLGTLIDLGRFGPGLFAADVRISTIEQCVDDVIKHADGGTINSLAVLGHGWSSTDSGGRIISDFLQFGNEWLSKANFKKYEGQFNRLRGVVTGRVNMRHCWAGLATTVMLGLAKSINVPVFGGTGETMAYGLLQEESTMRFDPGGGIAYGV